MHEDERHRKYFLLAICSFLYSGCGALNQKIDSGCSGATKGQKLLGDKLNLTTITSLPDKPMWLGAVMSANYSKNGLFDTQPETWKFTEPDFCSGLVEFFKEKDRYWVRMATSRACALVAKQATPFQTLQVSSEAAANLGFEGYLSLKLESPNFPQIKSVLQDSFGKVYESTRATLFDAGVDSYPYISFGSQLKKANEGELLRLACHLGTFLGRDVKAAYPTPEECLPAFWMDTFRNAVTKEDALKYQKELDVLVAATSELRSMRKSKSQLTADVTNQLDTLIDSFEKFELAQQDVDTWSGPMRGSLDCPKDKPCPAESRKNAIDVFIKNILPAATEDYTLLRDDPKNQAATDRLNVKVNAFVEVRNNAFKKLLEGLKLVSPALKDQTQNLSILSHHMTTPVPKAGAVKFKMVSLFSKEALPEVRPA
jgi:hypothetical protein